MFRKNIRYRVWKIVEAAESGDKASKIFDIFMVTLIFLNVAAVVLGTVPSIQSKLANSFRVFEIISVIAFTCEYVFRVWSCVEDKRFSRPVVGRLKFIIHPLPLLDLLAILPFFLTFTNLDLRTLRAIRLFRLIRILKASRYVNALRHFNAGLRSKREELILTTGLMLVLLIIASAVMFFAENEAQPDKFSSIPASMWWAVATLTTVGYGDVYPVTVMGKIAGAAIAVMGIGFFTLPTAILAAGLVESMRDHKTVKICPHCGKNIE